MFTIYDPLSTSGPNGNRYCCANNYSQDRFNPLAKLMQSVYADMPGRTPVAIRGSIRISRPITR